MTLIKKSKTFLVALIYFSPTNNTAKIATIIKEELELLHVDVEEIDITSYSDRQKSIEIEKYDALMFGFPIHAWRAPTLIRNWLQNLDGNGKKCSTFFTYGGVAAGAAHFNIKEILNKQNVILTASAEFLGKHSYSIGGWNLMEDRPNEDDFSIAREFARLSYDRFTGKDPNIVELEDPNLSERILNRMEFTATKAIAPPSRGGEECSMCRVCEEICPTNAMNADSGEPNKELCIRCYSCVLNCPDNVLKVVDLTMQFEFIKKSNGLTEEVLNNKKSIIFS